jgi:hypothetical protein
LAIIAFPPLGITTSAQNFYFSLPNLLPNLDGYYLIYPIFPPASSPRFSPSLMTFPVFSPIASALRHYFGLNGWREKNRITQTHPTGGEL